MKKILGILCVAILALGLVVSCGKGAPDDENGTNGGSANSSGGNNTSSNSSSSSSSSSSSTISDSDITVDTNKIELSDGTWNYDIAMPKGYVERGTFVVSDNATKLTYTKIYEGKNAYVNEMSEDRFNTRNSNPEDNMKNDFKDSTEFNEEGVYNYSIKTNSNKSKFKSVFTSTYSGETEVTTTLLQKVN